MKHLFARLFCPAILCCLIFSVIGVTAADAASTADFTMTDSELNIPASALLAIDGCFTYDSTQYERNAAIVIGSNNSTETPEQIRGQILLHGGKGDSYTFTVDFGNHTVDAFGFYSYGFDTAKDSRVSLEIDGNLIGEENAPGGNGWLDNDSALWFYNEIALTEPISGLHTIRITVTDSAPTWPANAVGNFLFMEAEAPGESDTFQPVPYDTSTGSPNETVENSLPDTALIEPDGAISPDDVSTPSDTTGCSGSFGTGIILLLTLTVTTALLCKQNHRADSRACRSVSTDRHAVRGLSLMLCLLLITATVSGCHSHDSNNNQSTEKAYTTMINDSQTDIYANPTETYDPTEPESATPDIDPTQPTDLFAYDQAESAALTEVIHAQRGMTVTYYSDGACTTALSSGRVYAQDGTEAPPSDAISAIYEGYICFDTDGEVTLSVANARRATLTLIRGEHHAEAHQNSVTFTVQGGTWYGVKLQVGFRDGQAIRLESTADYTLTVGRPLLGGSLPPIQPAMDIPMRDCQVCTGPDGYYYMTGTSGPDFWDNSRDIHVYRSADLVEWEDLGAVWDFERDATWAKRISTDTRVPVWAPEIAYVNDSWYIVYSMGFRDGYYGGILKSTTGLVTGPYTDTSVRPLANNIDLSLFEDTDGQIYLLWKDGLIARLNEDMSALAEAPHQLLAADGLPVGFEGTSIVRYRGLYYLTGATYNIEILPDGSASITYDSMVAVSETLHGPYSTTRLLLRNGGHNNLFVDHDGNIWSTLFAPTGNVGFSCQPALVRLRADARGVLTPSLTAAEPIQVAEDGTFEWLVREEDNLLIVSINTLRKLDVYINGVYAFTAEPSLATVGYTVTGEALESLVYGLNRITFSDTDRASLSFSVAGWYHAPNEP